MLDHAGNDDDRDGIDTYDVGRRRLGTCLASGWPGPRWGYREYMTDSSERETINEHEHLDAETVLDDAKELFEPDNPLVPPPQPDAPPPDDGRRDDAPSG